MFTACVWPRLAFSTLVKRALRGAGTSAGSRARRLWGDKTKSAEQAPIRIFFEDKNGATMALFAAAGLGLADPRRLGRRQESLQDMFKVLIVFACVLFIYCV